MLAINLEFLFELRFGRGGPVGKGLKLNANFAMYPDNASQTNRDQVGPCSRSRQVAAGVSSISQIGNNARPIEV